MTKTYIMNGLVEKMQSSDQDFRYMGLNDFLVAIKEDPNAFLGDEAVENKVLRQILSLVEDKISEVKNQAVKCLGQLIKIIRETQMEYVVDRLIDFSSSNDEELRDISGLALKTITAELPLEGKIAAKACEKLAPKLLVQLGNSSTPPDTLLETLSTLSILIIRFPTYVASPDLNPQPLTVLTPMLGHPRPAVRKRAITTLAQFLPTTRPEQFSLLLTSVILPGLTPQATIENQKTTIQLVAAVARHTPHQIGSELNKVVPAIIKAVKREDEELQESCLQAFEVLALRCPTEVTPFLSSITQVGNQMIKYDPNYAGDDDDDEDEEMEDGDEDEDADLGDEYSDDEDTSYKIRRSATKLLAAVIGTRPELLTTLYKEVSPVLISRFGDREETVRVEVWTTYGLLLTQTRVYGDLAQTRDTVGGKRKRDQGMEVEETPHSLLKTQVASLARALLNQLKSPKTSPTTLQAGFSLLHTLLTVLPGSLAASSAQIITTSKAVLLQASKTGASALQISCLSFIALFFSTHAPSTFVSSLDTIIPVLLNALGEKHPRVASEAFRAFSALLNTLKPVKGAVWVDSVYGEAVRRLGNHDTDAEVRACAEVIIGDLWICATDVMKTKDYKEWDAMCRTTGRTSGAVQVVTRVAKEVDIDDNWVYGCVQWLLILLKKSGRSGKAEMFSCLDALLRRYQQVSADLPPSLIPPLKSYITITDIPLMAQALSIVALLLELSAPSTFPQVESELLTDIYTIAHSPLVAGVAFDSVLAFFAALVEADMQVATHVVPNLVISIEKAPKTEASQSNVARCIGQVVKSQQAVAAGTIAEFSRHLKASSKAKVSQIVLSLLVMGEIGRFIDMSLQDNIFAQVIEYFSSDQEEIRTAAAFAAGNIAVGNLHHFLPVIVKMVQNDPEKRLLSLHALKEVVTHCSHGQLETVADTLWVPLFENSDNTEETTRNVAAACLGKLTTTHPTRYLPQLHERIRDQNPASRATVISAIRYTFAESSSTYDDLLSTTLMDFLSLIIDQDLTVRRLALSTLNSAARLKPYLIRDQLQLILPNLYNETNVKPELIRTVVMGPWTHKVDDGLETRKTAYETLYTLLDTCLVKLDLHEFLAHVLTGLSDDSDEVKVICHMMLFRLSQVAPTAVAQRLDDITPPLEKSMKSPPVAQHTVKQDLERAAELQRSTLRAVVALSKISQPGVNPRFDAFVEVTKKSGEWGHEFKDLEGI